MTDKGKENPMSVFPLPDGKFAFTDADGISFVCDTKAELRENLVKEVGEKVADALIEGIERSST